MMARIDYFNDPSAPTPTKVVPAASAIVPDENGCILLQRRSDNGFWALPGGAMDVGETIGDAAVREVKEETGLDVIPEYIIGIYTNPKHVVAFSDGEVRQEFSLCFACKLVGGEIQVSEESFEVAFFSPGAIERLNVHPSIRLRIQHYLEHRIQPYIG
jgi:8-oxo-dGTP pyrophosphatase MutT (NUDIX family)